MKILAKASSRLRNCFSFKDKLPMMMQSGLVYKFTCASCNASYYGQTIRHFKTRACEHLGMSHLTGKILRTRKTTAISDHVLECGCPPSLGDFSVLCRESNSFKLSLKESILIKRDRPILNRALSSMPLQLF